MKKYIIISAILAVSAPLAVFGAFSNDLYYGVQDTAGVQELQEFLTNQGNYAGPITGNFYSLTLAGVKSFQKANNINPVSGYFGPISRGVANGILDSSIPQDENSLTLGAVVSTTDDVIQGLLSQVVALQSQLKVLQEAQNTQITQQNQKIDEQTQIIQIQNETLTEIKKNTTPKPEPTSTPAVVPAPLPYELNVFAGPWSNLKLIESQIEGTIIGVTNEDGTTYGTNRLNLVIKQGDKFIPSYSGSLTAQVSAQDTEQNAVISFSPQGCVVAYSPSFSRACPKLDGKEVQNVLIAPFTYKTKTKGTHTITFYVPELDLRKAIDITVQ